MKQYANSKSKYNSKKLITFFLWIGKFSKSGETFNSLYIINLKDSCCYICKKQKRKNNFLKNMKMT